MSPPKTGLLSPVGTGSPGTASKPKVAFVGTYPPTQCGIATFSASLRDAMDVENGGVIAAVDEGDTTRFGPEVVAKLVRGSRGSAERAAAALEQSDAVILQHEFGIYGGEDGREVLDLVERLDMPMLVVLHTVLRRPSTQQRVIVEALAQASQAVIVQSEAARARLFEAYELAPELVRVVPHGAPRNVAAPTARAPDRRPVALTWGLLGDGKGIEFAIEALTLLGDLDPLPRYVIHGRTHPRVAATEGEAYREGLRARANTLGVADMVEFDNRYVDRESVLAWIREADVVVMPYRSRDQVVSGVLVEAIASGKPVVATRFPHAVELLAAGSGILVSHEDPVAIAAALRELLTDEAAAARARRVARRQAPRFFWENVAASYTDLCIALTSRAKATS